MRRRSWISFLISEPTPVQWWEGIGRASYEKEIEILVERVRMKIAGMSQKLTNREGAERQRIDKATIIVFDK